MGNTGKRGGQLNNTNASKWTEEKALEIGNDLLDWIKEDTKENIFVSDYLVRNGYYKDMVDYLQEKYESFSDIIKNALQIQEMKLVKYGTQGKLQPAITIFVLKNHHDYRDRTDQNINVYREAPLFSDGKS